MSNQASSIEDVSFDKSRWNKHQWLSYIESTHPSDIELGLDRVKKVAEKLDCLKPAKKVILLSGTNGKGTTSAMISALLAKVGVDSEGNVRSGFSSALYNSPHIVDYNERVSLRTLDDHRFIGDNELIQSFQAVETAREETPLTYFEFGTLAALWQIKRWDVDFAILEIGLGGRLDAVNIVDADVSIITSVGLDHMDWLGDTVEKIAYEKAGIAKADRPLVCGQLGAPLTVKEQAATHNANLYQAGESFNLVEHKSSDQILVSYTDFDGERQQLTLPEPNIPKQNVATAIQALALVDALPFKENISEAVSEVRVFGRMSQFECQLAGKSFTMIMDVAHNPQAAEYLAQNIGDIDAALLAMLADKDVSALVESFSSGQIAKWYLGGLADVPRGLTSEELEKLVAIDDVESFNAVEAALLAMMQALPEGGRCLVFGSFFTLQRAIESLHMLSDSDQVSFGFEWT